MRVPFPAASTMAASGPFTAAELVIAGE